jgi:hypothetical protein
MPSFLEKDRFVLEALRDYRDEVLLGKRMPFARIMDIMASPTSREAVVPAMKRLVVLGLVERRQRTDVPSPRMRWRPSYEYRITAAGLALVAVGGSEKSAAFCADTGGHTTKNFE